MGLKGILTSIGLNGLGIATTVVAALVFVGIVIWAYTRPREQIEADARLWMDDSD
jgi:hypothetical protein